MKVTVTAGKCVVAFDLDLTEIASLTDVAQLAATPKKRLVNPDLTSPEFESWWALYRDAIAPRTMSQKGKAFDEWKAGDCQDNAVKMMQALVQQIAYRAKMAATGKQENFVNPLPDPHRYIHNKMWREEIPIS
jgi:hypothetical protein